MSQYFLKVKFYTDIKWDFLSLARNLEFGITSRKTSKMQEIPLCVWTNLRIVQYYCIHIWNYLIVGNAQTLLISMIGSLGIGMVLFCIQQSTSYSYMCACEWHFLKNHFELKPAWILNCYRLFRLNYSVSCLHSLTYFFCSAVVCPTLRRVSAQNRIEAMGWIGMF